MSNTQSLYTLCLHRKEEKPPLLFTTTQRINPNKQGGFLHSLIHPSRTQQGHDLATIKYGKITIISRPWGRLKLQIICYIGGADATSLSHLYFPLQPAGLGNPARRQLHSLFQLADLGETSQLLHSALACRVWIALETTVIPTGTEMTF